MSQNRYSEAAFVTVIEAHLLKSGYTPLAGENLGVAR